MKRSGDDLTSDAKSKKWRLAKPLDVLRNKEAWAFLKEIRKTFKDEKEELDTFYAVVKDTYEKMLGPASFTDRIEDIIKGHTNLTDLFNLGLPYGIKIYRRWIAEVYRHLIFCEEVEKRLGSKDEFQKFTDILYSMGPADTITKQKYLSEITFILGNHQDLMDEFNELLETKYPKMKRSRDDLRSGRPSKKPKLKKLSRVLKKLDAQVFLSEFQKTFKDEKEKLRTFSAVVKDKNEQRLGPASFTARVQDIIRGHTNLTDIFKVTLPEGNEIYLRGFVFCEKVDERLGSEDEFQKFMDILYSMRSMDTITKQKQKYLSAIHCILGNHQDLMDEFNELFKSGYMYTFLAGDVFD